MKFIIKEKFSDWECGDGCCYNWNTEFNIDGIDTNDYFNDDTYYDNLDEILNGLIRKHCIYGYDDRNKPLFCSSDIDCIYSLESLSDFIFDEDYETFEYPRQALEFLGYKIIHHYTRVSLN